MARQHNTTTRGGSFDQQTIEAVWQKAQPVAGYNPNEYRKDSCNMWIQKGSYGMTTDYGWEVDHLKPVSLGGSDVLGNLQPLHWRNNRGKGDDYPHWKCSISAKV